MGVGTRSSRAPTRILALFILASLLVLTQASQAAADFRFGSEGSAAGQLRSPNGIATDFSDGHVYVADTGNHRIDVFASDGSFIRAFGWGVSSGAAELQTCTVTCRAGIVGAGDGQFRNPHEIAVDNDPASSSYRDVYVTEANSFNSQHPLESETSYRVQQFTPEGSAFVLTFGGGVNGTTGGDVCTAASGNLCGPGSPGTGPGELNQCFVPEAPGECPAPLAVGPGGTVYVGDNFGTAPNYESRIAKFSSNGVFESDLSLGAGKIESLAVDSTGAVYAALHEGGPPRQVLRKYSSGGAELPAPSVEAPAEVAVGETTDDLFVVGEEEAEPSKSNISQFAADGTLLRRFGYPTGNEGIQTSLKGLSAPGAGEPGDIVLGSEEGFRRLVALSIPPAGPLIGSLSATGISNIQATLQARINPEGKETTYHFEYVTNQQFVQTGFAGPDVVSMPAAVAGSDFKLDLVQAAICTNPATELADGKCLQPETKYHFRVVASNSDGSPTPVEGEPFTTKPPMELLGSFATEVETSTAKLSAEVNPLNIPTTGFFQYVPDATYQGSVRAAEEAGDPNPKAHGFDQATSVPDVGGGQAALDFGAAGSTVRSIQLSGLTSRTAYHYRVILTDSLIEPSQITGPAGIFTTTTSEPLRESCPNDAFRVGPSARLPDCRAYEMVSPVDKNGTDILSLININGLLVNLDQSAVEGGRLTYTTSQGFGDTQGVPYLSQYLASRESTGWTNHGLTPPQGLAGIEVGRRIDLEMRAFTPDLCFTALRQNTNLLLAPGAVERYINLYIRRNCGGDEYTAVTTTEPPVQPPTQTPTQAPFEPEVQGLSADGRCAVFYAEDSLTPTDPIRNEEITQLYESCGGQLGLVSVLPDGAIGESGASAGTANDHGAKLIPSLRTTTDAGAVSSDGSLVYWTAASGGEAPLYVRENASQPQSALNGSGRCIEAAKACTYLVSSDSSTHFWAASLDGSRTLYTANGSITAAAGATLFEYSFKSKTSKVIAAGVQGFIGASEDGSRAAFVSRLVLVTGANDEGRSPTAGQPNLYYYDSAKPAAERFRFIGTLSQADMLSQVEGAAVYSPAAEFPYLKTSRVSPDGTQVVLSSSASLTGYDNRDSASGEPDAEVFAYDASAAGGNGDLRCVSCNPTGGRPTGRLATVELNNHGTWTAGFIPGFQTELYGSRVMSADGRQVFFVSYEPLVPRDLNGKADVYQWEAPSSTPGGNRCTVQSPAYSEVNQGCISLISTGEAPTDATFLDASADGTDVFFTTDQSLLPQDPGLIDIYDARQGGGFPLRPSAATPCEGESCQRSVGAPGVPSPGSTTPGPGNPKPRCPKAAHRKKVKGHTRCVKGHKVKKHKKKHGGKKHKGHKSSAKRVDR